MASTQASVLEGRLYLALQRFSGAVLLSTTWVVASLPVITVGPATAAMFGVVRRWELGDDPAVFGTFIRYFRENLQHGLLTGLVGIAVTALLLADLVIAGALVEPFGSALAVSAAIGGVVVLAAAVYAFPLMVTYTMPWARLIRVSVMFAVGRPATTLTCLAVIVAAAAVTYVFPLAPLLAASLVAIAVHRLSMRAVAEVEGARS